MAHQVATTISVASNNASPKTEISFSGPSPDLTSLVIEKLHLSSDRQTFTESLQRVVGLNHWDQMATLQKVWAVLWRVVLVTAILAVGIKFLGPLAALFLIGISVAFLTAGGVAQYHHNHTVTLGALKERLAQKTWKSFSSALNATNDQYQLDLENFVEVLWNRLQAKLCEGVSNKSTTAAQQSYFAHQLSNFNMESFLHDIFVDLEERFQNQSPQPLTTVKMRIAYDITENLWARYQKQMEHYPWFEDPNNAGCLVTEEQIKGAADKMIYQRITMGCELLRYFIYQYIDGNNPHRPQFNQAYVQAAQARHERVIDSDIEERISQKERGDSVAFSKEKRECLRAQWKHQLTVSLGASVDFSQNEFLKTAGPNLVALTQEMGFNKPIVVPLSDKTVPNMMRADFEKRLRNFHPETVRRDVANFFRTLHLQLQSEEQEEPINGLIERLVETLSKDEFPYPERPQGCPENID